jgi:uncharacterized protein (UPF0264 family)
MRLLVSVANATEASAAFAGGADIIDAKDPLAGSLGAVPITVLAEIHAAVNGAHPVTAAIGDAADEAAIEATACVFAAAGSALVKVGFAGIASASRIAALTAAAMRGVRAGSAGDCGVILVAYADATRATSLAPAALVDVAAHAGARGVLLDTADKRGPGLRARIAPDALAAWVARAHQTISRSCATPAPTSPACAARRARVDEQAGCRPKEFGCSDRCAARSAGIACDTNDVLDKELAEDAERILGFLLCGLRGSPKRLRREGGCVQCDVFRNSVAGRSRTQRGT